MCIDRVRDSSHNHTPPLLVLADSQTENYELMAALQPVSEYVPRSIAQSTIRLRSNLPIDAGDRIGGAKARVCAVRRYQSLISHRRNMTNSLQNHIACCNHRRQEMFSGQLSAIFFILHSKHCVKYRLNCHSTSARFCIGGARVRRRPKCTRCPRTICRRTLSRTSTAAAIWRR